ncbi:MAG: hypothetical protein GF408_00775 [Candidatus Omnitrophica bacterium]|nr:hypothetical protein [Candidatus Omnitrophota bacterium]
MDLLTRRDLTELTEIKDHPCVSMYMPAGSAGEESEKNRIRFKNLLKAAREQVPRSKYGDMYTEAEALQENTLFWNHQDKGLAFFMAPGFTRYYRLPMEFRREVIVSDLFHIKPLLTYFMETGVFYILAFSLNGVRLFRGMKFSISEIDVPGMPEDMAGALRFDVPQRSLEFHTRTSSARGNGGRPAVFHGQGAAADKREHKKNVLRYFQKIDKALAGFLRDSRDPLVLAGDESFFPIYREANSYNFLEDEGIPGNPEHVTPESLHEKARQITEPIFREKMEKDRERFVVMAEKEMETASADHKEVLKKAVAGKVDTLFVASGKHEWGRYDPEHGAFRVDSLRKKDSEDLLELAAVHALKHGGAVHALEAEAMPGGHKIAAIFRK